MEKKLVKVVPSILDIEDPETDLQEALFSLEEETLLKLDRNEATVTPSPMVYEALTKSLDRLSLNRQPDNRSRKLRRKLAHYSGVNFDNISCFANTTIAVDTIARTYLQPGLDALVGCPCENSIAGYIGATGAGVIFSKHENSFEPKVEEFAAGMTSKTRLIYLANPNGISGSILTESEIVFLLSYAENAMVVIDESYFEFCGVTVSKLLSRYPNLAVLRTFSKAFALASMDVAYLMTDERNLKYINRLSCNKAPNTLAQVAAESAIDDLRYTASFVRIVNESKKMLFENLVRMGYDFRITSANFFLLRVKDPDSLVETLTRNNIFVNNLLSYPEYENQIRITIGTPSQTGVLIDILARQSDTQTLGKSLETSANRLKEPLRPIEESLVK